jgi:serine/threonine protein kinase
MEYMELGDLERHIKDHWTEGNTKVVARQLLQGLKSMHQEGILHRDLKPAVSISGCFKNSHFLVDIAN